MRSTTVFHKRYSEHSHRVKSLVPPENYNVQQGWKPPCGFLGCVVPTVALQRENVKGELVKVPLSETRFGWQCKRKIQRAVFVILTVVIAIII